MPDEDDLLTPTDPAPEDDEAAVDPLEDPAVASMGTGIGRTVAFLVMLAGLLGLAVERRFEWATDSLYLVSIESGIRYLWVFVGIALVGGIAYLVMSFVPMRRTTPVAKAFDAELDVDSTAFQARLWRGLGLAGGALLAAGVLAVAAVYSYSDYVGHSLMLYLQVGGGAALLGALLLLVARLRLPHAQMAFVQASFLAEEEAVAEEAEAAATNGVASGDPRVGRVLGALDGLLGGLPDDALTAFMSKPEAEDYLALLEETRREA